MSNETTSKNEVYSEYDGEYNIKSRLVRYNHCKYEVITDLPQPKCKECRSNLITVISRVLSDE